MDNSKKHSNHKSRYEPSIRVALREQTKRGFIDDEDVLDQASDDDVLREFGGRAHGNDDEY